MVISVQSFTTGGEHFFIIINQSVLMDFCLPFLVDALNILILYRAQFPVTPLTIAVNSGTDIIFGHALAFVGMRQGRKGLWLCPDKLLNIIHYSFCIVD